MSALKNVKGKTILSYFISKVTLPFFLLLLQKNPGVEARFFLELSFKGTAFYGWQIQPQSPTVQQAVADALSTVLKKNTKVTGAGRTDAGVHAKGFFAHFDAEESMVMKNKKFIFQLNGILGHDIAVHRLHRVKANAHARYSAISRSYQYFITQEKDPFFQDYQYFHSRSLDLDAMNTAAQVLFQYNDFTSFSKLHSHTETNLCHIMEAEWKQLPGKIIFTIKADRFLRNMVRAIVGTLIQVGSGKLNPDDMHRIINQRDRSLAGPSAPAHGLMLVKIEYPDELMVSSIP